MKASNVVLAPAHKDGRPGLVAVVPFRNSRKMALLNEFYETCAAFRYPDIVALSRAFRMQPRTIENWKYKVTFPRWDIAVDVIEWVRAGKPTVRMSTSKLSTPIM